MLTGGASGIGLETAKLLAERGAILSISDLNQKGLDEALKQLKGSKHIASVVDVRDGLQVKQWIEKTVRELGRIDGCANVAGAARMPAVITEATDSDWDFMIGVNARGVFNCMREQLKHLQSGAAIVSGSTFVPFTTVYPVLQPFHLYWAP